MTVIVTFDLDLYKVKIKGQDLGPNPAKLLKRFQFAENVFTFLMSILQWRKWKHFVGTGNVLTILLGNELNCDLWPWPLQGQDLGPNPAKFLKHFQFAQNVFTFLMSIIMILLFFKVNQPKSPYILWCFSITHNSACYKGFYLLFKQFPYRNPARLRSKCHI